jgi:hypothetical protein
MTLMPKRTPEETSMGNARLLAEIALKGFKDPQFALENGVGLNNVNFMVRSYGHGLLELPDHIHGSYQRVRDALEKAAAGAFPNYDRERTASDIEDMLRKIAYPGKFGELSEFDRRKAVDFFSIFSKELS